MNEIDRVLFDKYKEDKEFYGILVASKDNPWLCEDVIIPKQKVTGASIIVPKEGMLAPYQKHFEDCIVGNKSQIVVGTIHSHNSMSCFFSGGDDEDLENNSCFNLNEGLPFIDIVWSNKDNSYKARVRMKIGKGESKQIFTHEECECIIVPDTYTKEITHKIKSMLTDEYTINEDILNRAIRPVIKVDDVVGNIQVEDRELYGRYPSYQRILDIPKINEITKGGNVELEVADYNDTEKILLVSCKGSDEDTTNFLDELETGLGYLHDRRCTSFLGDSVSCELKCESKNRYKKIKNRIFQIHHKFQENGKNPKVQTELNKPMTIEEQADAFHGGGYGEDYPSYLG